MRLKREKVVNHFTQIPNETLRNKTLSDGSYRLLTYMLSFSDEWEFYNERIAKELNKNVRTIQRYLGELEENGYITRKPMRDSTGKIVEWERIVHQEPHDK